MPPYKYKHQISSIAQQPSCSNLAHLYLSKIIHAHKPMSNGGQGDKEGPVAVGQWGGEGGSPWDDGAFTGIRQIVIGHGASIDSILIEYDQDGSSVWSKKHGGSGGRIDKIVLEYPDEHLISVSGHVSSYIRSLTFESNKRKYGPFGSRRGLPFSLPPLGRKIVGFYGKSGRVIDAIGVYLKPIKESINPRDFVLLTQNQNETSDDADMARYEYEVQEAIKVEEACCS